MAESQLPEFDPNPQQQQQPLDAPAPQLAAPSNASQPPLSQTAQREVKRRNRRPVVCMPCRERRSKCSREKPCSLCLKRGEAHLCVYAEPIDRSGAQAATRSARTAASRAKQLDQLSQLESLFKRYLQGSQVGTLPDPKGQGYGYGAQQPTPMATESDGLGHDETDASFAPHWSSLFRQLRSNIEGYEDGMSDAGDGIVTSEEKPILLGATPPTSLAAILRQYLPQDKAEVSNRLNTYFGATYMVIPVIHSGKFLSEYEDFWAATPETVDPIWVALLFAILSLSAHITAIQGNDADVARHENWIGACSQCLSLGGYTKPRPYLIPALLMLAQSQYMRYLDPSREVSLIVSIVARLAFQSGLHREPGLMVPPFEAEMRRRLWVMVRHFDCQVACQFGVPASAQYDAADIEAPRNLQDGDLHEGMTELPPSRPETEISPTNSFAMKNKFMTLFSEIYTHALNLRTTTEDAEIDRFESALQTQHSEIPTIFKPKPIALSLNDPDSLRMFRVTLDFLYHKALIILHRRRMSRAHAASRSTCLASANSIITTFDDLVAELRPGRLMEGKAWMLSATVVNDFLLACMTVCMALVTDPSSPSSARKQSPGQDREEHLNILETARAICVDLSPKSRGAVRVGNAVHALLTRYGRDQPMDPRLTANVNSQSQMNPAYQPAQPYSLNGFPVAAPSQTQEQPPNSQPIFGAFPSPAPSSALSQERSTSGVSNGAPGTSWLMPDQPMLPGLFPSANQQSQQGQVPQGLFVAQGQQPPPQQGQFVGDNGPTDIFARFSSGGVPGGEIDWTAFDQYITEF